MTVEESKQRILSLLDKPAIEQLHNLVRKQLISELGSASTASEVAAAVGSRITALYHAYPKELLEVLAPTLSAAQWQNAGVLLNPETIPAEGPITYYVLGSSDCKVTQTVDKEVIYFGDMNVRIQTGIAHVHNTRNWVLAGGDARVFAGGLSRVKVDDYANLVLGGCAKAEAYDSAVVTAGGRSFVNVKSDDVKLLARAQSQFLIEHFNPRVTMQDNARGYIRWDMRPEKPKQLFISDLCLLYTSGKEADAIRVVPDDFLGTYIKGQNLSHTDSLMMDLVIPRYCAQGQIERGIRFPMDLDQLKMDLRPFTRNGISNEEQTFLFDAPNEREVCSRMMTFFDKLVDNGMTGEFLRTHFTEDTLELNQIHAFSQPNPNYLDTEINGTHRFFGDQMIYANTCNGSVKGYEHTLVINSHKNRVVELEQSAHGMVVDQGVMQANGNSKVVAMDQSSVKTIGKAFAQLQDHAQGTALGESILYAYGESSAKATDRTLVHLHEHSHAEVDGQARVLADGVNNIRMLGESIVVYPTFAPNVQVTIDRVSDKAEVRELRTFAVHTAYLTTLLGNKSQEENRQRGH